jgi:hypothetical protein
MTTCAAFLRTKALYSLLQERQCSFISEHDHAYVQALENQYLQGDCTEEGTVWHSLRGIDREHALRQYVHIVSIMAAHATCQKDQLGRVSCCNVSSNGGT